MENVDPEQIKEVEALIMDFLTKFDKGSIEDVYQVCRSYIPYYLLKDVFFRLFKIGTLRRQLVRNFPTEYRIAALHPKFGSHYIPRKPQVRTKEHKRQYDDIVNSCREQSKVFTFDQLIRTVRD
ncbi:hypothetical protein F3J37_01335 [Pantoea sp. Al-1710]|uniref:Uncharacterized protein n=1 Tax=Candidatus Pantoea communis TaxID=2608354 RepID=A0ABX0RNT1_9GAMM|nr:MULTISPECIES: hypothetical protein [Pantoea]NIG12979.1 hypothetical protein [Pantoea sp. Cy-640]NIG17320.1 hypothetical protein [Pantoea communis]